MTTIDGINYNLGSNTATVGYNSVFSGAANIPATVSDGIKTYTVVAIDNKAFQDCFGLRSVTIPDSVISIGDNAFYNCLGLTSVTIGNSVITIGYQAFQRCSKLTSVTIPTSVTSIGNNAFQDCSKLTSVTIPASVTSIGESAFIYCSELTAINVDVNNPNYSSADGVLFNKDNQTILIQFPGGKAGAYSIPDSVQSIGNKAFINCSKLTSVTIPASVTSIGAAAFYVCTGVVSAYFLGDSVEYTGNAFKPTTTQIYVKAGAIGWGETWGGCTVIKPRIHNYTVYFRK